MTRPIATCVRSGKVVAAVVRSVALTGAALCLPLLSACSTPPPPSTPDLPTSSTVPGGEVWNPLGDTKEGDLPTWALSLLPLPDGKQYSALEVGPSSFSGQWETTGNAVEVAGIYVTRLLRTGWTEESRQQGLDSVSYVLRNSGDVRLEVTGASVGGTNRFTLTAEQVPDASA